MSKVPVTRAAVLDAISVAREFDDDAMWGRTWGQTGYGFSDVDMICNDASVCVTIQARNCNMPASLDVTVKSRGDGTHTLRVIIGKHNNAAKLEHHIPYDVDVGMATASLRNGVIDIMLPIVGVGSQDTPTRLC